MMVFRVLFIFCLLSLASSAWGQTVRWASPSGSGTTCTSATPCSLSTGMNQVQAGQILRLRNGNYIGAFNTVKSGTVANPITIEAENKWGARISLNSTCSTSSTQSNLTNISHDNLIIRGLDFDFCRAAGINGGIRIGASSQATNVIFEHNRIRDTYASGIHTTNASNNIVIRHNRMQDTGHRATWGECNYVSNGNNMELYGNTFHGCTENGIDIKSNSFSIHAHHNIFEDQIPADEQSPELGCIGCSSTRGGRTHGTIRFENGLNSEFHDNIFRNNDAGGFGHINGLRDRNNIHAHHNVMYQTHATDTSSFSQTVSGGTATRNELNNNTACGLPTYSFTGSGSWNSHNNSLNVNQTLCNTQVTRITNEMASLPGATYSEEIPSSTDTHYVSPSGSGSVCTQASPCSVASAFSKALAGHTIIFTNGTYPRFETPKADLTYKAENQHQAIISYASATSPFGAIRVLHNNTTIDGLRVTCNETAGGSGHGCVNLQPVSGYTMRNSIVEDSRGGLHNVCGNHSNNCSNILLEDNIFRDSGHSAEFGEGIYIAQNAGENVVNGVVIRRNTIQLIGCEQALDVKPGALNVEVYYNIFELQDLKAGSGCGEPTQGQVFVSQGQLNFHHNIVRNNNQNTSTNIRLFYPAANGGFVQNNVAYNNDFQGLLIEDRAAGVGTVDTEVSDNVFCNNSGTTIGAAFNAHDNTFHAAMHADCTAKENEILALRGDDVPPPPPPPEGEYAQCSSFDTYGGCEDTVITGSPSGFFETQKVGNRWWFVTPDGNAFVSFSVSVLNPNGVDGADQLGNTYEDYVTSKYGGVFPTWRENWANATITKLKSWGFNTIGTDSHFIIDEPSLTQRLPYVQELRLSNSVLLDGHVGNIWEGVPNGGQFPDIYHPDFISSVGTEMAAVFPGSRITDPYLLYHFIDQSDQLHGIASNHGSLCYGAWVSKPTFTDAKVNNFKIKLRDDMQAQYGTIAALNAAWGTSYTTFASAGGYGVGTGFMDQDPARTTIGPTYADLDAEATAAMVADCNTFTEAAWAHYATVVTDAVHDVDPNHLIASPNDATNEEAVKAFSGKFDLLWSENTADYNLLTTKMPIVSPPFRFITAESDSPLSLHGTLHTQTQITGSTIRVWDPDQEHCWMDLSNGNHNRMVFFEADGQTIKSLGSSGGNEYDIDANGIDSLGCWFDLSDLGASVNGGIDEITPETDTFFYRRDGFDHEHDPFTLNGVGYLSQEGKAARWRDGVQEGLLERASNGDYVRVAANWWKYSDNGWTNTLERHNWGLVTLKDNAYDGGEATTIGADGIPGSSDDEEANHGNLLAIVSETNLTIYDFIATESTTEPVEPDHLLISHLTFDNTLADATGHVTPAYGGGGSPVYVPGIVGSAIQLDGNHFVSLETHTIDGTELFASSDNAFSVALFFKVSELACGTLISSAGDTPSDRDVQIFTQANTIDAWLRGVRTVSPSVSHHDGVWHHVAMTWNGNAGQLYINGEFAKFMTPGTSVEDTLENIIIGARSGGTGFPFIGAIDDVRIYNYALSAAEVTTLAGGTVVDGGNILDGLVAYWPLDGTLLDEQGNANLTHSANSPTYTTGAIDEAITLNGSEFLTTGTHTVAGVPLFPAPGQPFSVSLWFNTTATGTLIASAVSALESRDFQIALAGADSRFDFYLRGEIRRSTGTGYADGVWHHLVFTWDGVTATYSIDNGADTGTLVVGISPEDPSEPIFLGARTGGTGFPYTGSLDDVRIYSRALTEADISALFDFFPDDSPPSTPVNLQVFPVSSSRIDLQWTPSEDGSPITYHVEMCEGSGCETFGLIDTTTTASYSVVELLPGTTYRFRVQAEAAGDVSGYSTPVEGTTPSFAVARAKYQFGVYAGGILR